MWRNRHVAEVCWLLLIGLSLACPSKVVGQTAGVQDNAGNGPAKLPAFEVASIRAVPANRGGMTSISAYGEPRFTATNITLELLIAIAYRIDGKNILGKPEWLDSALFDVAAKPEGDAGLSYDQLRPLLQQLLQQRFHLTVHRETKETSGYALVVAKDGTKLKANKEEPVGTAFIMLDELRGPNISMEVLAGLLSRPVDRPVVDRTALAGSYDITLHFAPENSTDSTLPSIFTAVQEQLGLKLVPQKVPVERLTIDHVDREPTDN
jgi:uncharacterized protein (TIGR03435 family)